MRPLPNCEEYGLTLCAWFIDSSIQTVQDFVDLSEAIVALSVSTYAGMISTLTSKVLQIFSPVASPDQSLFFVQAYVGLLGGILGVEGRHSAWISSSLKGGSPWNTPFEVRDVSASAYYLLSSFSPDTNKLQPHMEYCESLRHFVSAR